MESWLVREDWLTLLVWDEVKVGRLVPVKMIAPHAMDQDERSLGATWNMLDHIDPGRRRHHSRRTK